MRSVISFFWLINELYDVVELNHFKRIKRSSLLKHVFGTCCSFQTKHLRKHRQIWPTEIHFNPRATWPAKMKFQTGSTLNTKWISFKKSAPTFLWLTRDNFTSNRRNSLRFAGTWGDPGDWHLQVVTCPNGYEDLYWSGPGRSAQWGDELWWKGGLLASSYFQLPQN